MPAADAITEVRAKAMKLSEGKPGVEIAMTSGVAFIKGKASLTLELREANLYDVLKEIAKRADIVLTFEDGTAALWMKEELADSKVVLTDAQKAWLKRGDDIILPRFDVKEALLPDVIKLLNAQAKAADPKKSGWPVELSPGAKAAKTKLTFTLEGQSASAVLNMVLELTLLRKKVTDSKVILSTLGEG